MLLSSKASSHEAYWVIDPAHSMPNVILILPLEDQSPVRVVLLRRPIELSVHLGALENAPVLIGVDALALQGVVHVIALQGAAREGRTKGIVSPWLSSPKRKDPTENQRPVVSTSSRILLND